MEYKKVSQIVGLLEQRNEFSDSISDSINIEKFIVLENIIEKIYSKTIQKKTT